MKALVFDFETTGLPFHPNARAELQPRAIEFAGVLVDESGQEHAELSFLCNPGQQISDVITKITGLTNEDLKDAKSFGDYTLSIRSIMQRTDILIAHNLPFDHGILAHELAVIDLLQGWPWPKQNLCTAQLYEPIWGRRPRLIELFDSVTGSKYEQTHRAMDDVRALARIVQQEKLIQQIESVPNAFGTYFPTGFAAGHKGAA